MNLQHVGDRSAMRKIGFATLNTGVHRSGPARSKSPPALSHDIQFSPGEINKQCDFRSYAVLASKFWYKK